MRQGRPWARGGDVGERRAGKGRPSPQGADTYSIGVGGDLYGAVDFAAAPAIGLGGPGGHAGSQLADRRGPVGRAGRMNWCLASCVRRAGTPRAARPRSAALQPRAPPPSLPSLRCFPLPFLQTLLPFPRQQNLGPDCSSEMKGGQGPRGSRGWGLRCLFLGTAGHCGFKRKCEGQKKAGGNAKIPPHFSLPCHSCIHCPPLHIDFINKMY